MNTKIIAITAIVALFSTASVTTAQDIAKGKPFGGQPWPIPGLIQAENFDEGPEGVAFHETDGLRGNLVSRPYRNSPVDIEDTPEGTFHVGFIAAGEWLTYTVVVKRAGTYDIELSMGAEAKPSSLHIEFNGVDKTGPIQSELTKHWYDYAKVRKAGVHLDEGIQVMKVVFKDSGDTNLDSLRFIEVNPPKTEAKPAAVKPETKPAAK